MKDKKFIGVLLILCILGVFGSLSYLPARFDTSPAIPLSAFPAQIGEWVSDGAAVSDKTYEPLQTGGLLSRNYRNPAGDIINLYLAYSPDNRKATSPVETCLEDTQETITNKSPIVVPGLIQATKLVIEDDASRDLVIYWYRAGTLNTDNYLKQQLRVSLNRMFGKKTSFALIKLTTPLKSTKEEEALDKLKSFCKSIGPFLDKYLP